MSSLLKSPLWLLPQSLLTNRNVRLLFLQRFIRLYAYGSSTLILAHFFAVLKNPTSKTGLFMTLTLYGDVGISLLLTLFADRLGRRNTLMLGASLMILSGMIFAMFSNFWILLSAAILGVISPSGNEIGPFRAIEESVTAQIVEGGARTEIFAWYTLIGALGTALGSMSCGWLVHILADENGKGWGEEKAYRAIFWMYAGMGVVKLVLAWGLTGECELTQGPEGHNVELEREGFVRNERDGLRSPRLAHRVVKFLIPNMSTESLSILWKLCLLFAVDSTASGLAPASWLTYFFTTKHSLPAATLGMLFFTTSLFSAASSLLAVPISKRLGLIRTMVYTHLPAAIMLTLIPLPPSSSVGTGLAMSFLIVRSLMASMDQAPRTAFLAAVMMPNERTAVMGVVNTIKTFSQGAGPFVTGWLGEQGKMGVAFIIAGLMKVAYDVGLLSFFLRGGVSQRVKDGDRDQEVRYKSVQVEEGDSLEELEEATFLNSSDEESE